MTVTRYKPLFSVNASYVLTGLGVLTNGMLVKGFERTEEKMRGLRLLPQYKGNTVTVFYEGTETALNSVPLLEITTNEYFYFGIRFSSKEKISRLRFHSTPAIAKAIGFPVLYDAAVKTSGGLAELTIREDVKVMPAVFTFTVAAADTTLTSGYAALQVRDEKNAMVDLNLQPAALNEKALDGPGAIPEFAFSIDASLLEPGIYEFQVGSFKKKFFLGNGLDLTDAIAIVRVLKNSFLEYRQSLADKTLVEFEFKIPAA